MTRHRARAGAAAVLCALVAAGGCSPLATIYQRRDPTTGVGFLLGELRADLQAGPAHVAAATKSAFHALGIRERFSDVSGLDAELTGRTARGSKVRVVIRPASPGRSSLHIRVGALGDRAMSTSLLETIQALLPPAARQPGL